jgi:hypothetical protein
MSPSSGLRFGRSTYESWSTRRDLSNGEVQIVFYGIWPHRSDRWDPQVWPVRQGVPILGANNHPRTQTPTPTYITETPPSATITASSSPSSRSRLLLQFTVAASSSLVLPPHGRQGSGGGEATPRAPVLCATTPCLPRGRVVPPLPCPATQVITLGSLRH